MADLFGSITAKPVTHANNWCPNDAIYGKIVEYNDHRHHPDVKLADMMTKNRKSGGPEGN